MNDIINDIVISIVISIMKNILKDIVNFTCDFARFWSLIDSNVVFFSTNDIKDIEQPDGLLVFHTW